TINADGPTVLVLTRQNVPVLEGSKDGARTAIKNGAVEVGSTENPKIILVGTGSEVHVCVEAAEKLAAEGIQARVISMPNVNAFLSLAQSEKDSLLTPGVPVITVEAATTF